MKTAIVLVVALVCATVLVVTGHEGFVKNAGTMALVGWGAYEYARWQRLFP
jgi:apolipoprotein N-acyltransferase